jgi:hypothetical protein
VFFVSPDSAPMRYKSGNTVDVLFCAVEIFKRVIKNDVMCCTVLCGLSQCVRTVIDRDDGMVSRRLAENRCGNF